MCIIQTSTNHKKLGGDVRRIRCIRIGEKILEVKRDPKANSFSSIELTEEAVVDKLEVRALCPKTTLQCKYLDEVTLEEEGSLVMKLERCELGEALVASIT